MTHEDRQRVRDALDRRARRCARADGVKIDLDPVRVRYCEAIKDITANGANERCSNVALPESNICGVHRAAAAGVYRKNGHVEAQAA